MGAFGFFLFLSVVVISNTYKSIKETRIKQDTLFKILEQGCGLTNQQLELLVTTPPRMVPFLELKIGVLLFVGVGAIGLSIAYWEKGMLPVLFAGLIAMAVAYATFNHARTTKHQNDGSSEPFDN